MKDILKEVSLELENIGSIEDAVGVAISLEDQGHDFYLEKGDLSKNPGTKKAYEFLAEEEKHHAQYLQKFLDGRDVEMSESRIPDFRGSLNKEFSGNNLEEIAILLGALRFERKSEYFYIELEKIATDESQKEFFSKIANVERDHYEIIDSLLDEATDFRMQT
ncbi:MAG: ferritin family protein [Euryarchaeota archaeon]|nr:ferritin family protein [Euryarchaeota archaeon]